MRRPSACVALPLAAARFGGPAGRTMIAARTDLAAAIGDIVHGAELGRNAAPDVPRHG